MEMYRCGIEFPEHDVRSEPIYAVNPKIIYVGTLPTGLLHMYVHWHMLLIFAQKRLYITVTTSDL